MWNPGRVAYFKKQSVNYRLSLVCELQSYQMKAEPPSLNEEVAMNQEKNRVAYMRVEAVVDHMIELYQQAEKSIRTGKNHQEVIEGLNQQLMALRPLKTVREHFVHYYRKLSNLIRRLQNGTKTTNPTLSRYNKRKDSNGNALESNNSVNGDRFNRFFDRFITKDEERRALQTMIVEHFLREGRWECANVWSQIIRDVDPNRQFNECHKLRDRIRKGEFEQAISWCQNQRLFETKSNLLEYELIKAQIVSFVDKGQHKKAMQYYKKRLKKFQSLCQSEIQKLMGYILFKEQTFWGSEIKKMPELYSFCGDRYAGFSFSNQKCEKLAQTFVKEFLRQNNISQFDVLKIVYNCSKKISDEYQRLMSVTWQSERKQQRKYESLLPFSIQLDKQYQYHSLFLCPVTKEVHSSGQPSILLSCGHLISQPAQERIVLESRNRRKVKCPICQKEIHHEDSISVEF